MSSVQTVAAAAAEVRESEASIEIEEVLVTGAAVSVQEEHKVSIMMVVRL